MVQPSVRASRTRRVPPRIPAALLAVLLAASANATPMLPLPGAGGGAAPELQRAVTHLKAGEIASARRVTQDYVARQPGDAAGQEMLGHIRMQQGDLRGAGENLRRAVELDPQRASAWLRLSVSQAAVGRPAAARDSLQRAVAAGAAGEQANGLQARLDADIAAKEAQLRKARRALERGGAEEVARRLHEVVDLHFALERESAAVEILERYAARHPRDRTLGLLLAGTYAAVKQPQKALDETRRVAREHPESARAVYMQAKLLADMAQDHAALDALERSLAMDPGQVDAWIALSSVHHGHEGHADVHAESREALLRGLKANPESPALLLLLAEMQREEGELTAANATLRRLLRERHEDAVAMARLSLNLSASPAPHPESDRLAVEAARLEPDLPIVRHAVGRSRQVAGDWRAAITQLEPVCFGPGATGEVCLHLAQAFAAAGRSGEAAASARHAVALGLAGADAGAAKKLLEELNAS